MSFIAGYILKSGKLDASWVKQKLADFSILADDEPDSYENGIVSIPAGQLLWKYRKNFPLPPAVLTDGDSILLTHGFHLPQDQRKSGRDLIQKCRHRGPQLLENFEGEFVSVYSGGATETLHIVNDRFGSRPMFLLNNHSGIFFSSNILFLHYITQIKQKPDIIGCLQLFSYGHTIGERTTVSNIMRMAPANHLILTPEKITKRRYWKFEHVPQEGLDQDKYSEEVFDAFKSATLSRIRLFGKGVVALSGGLDSRLLAGAVPGDSGFDAFTFVDSTESNSTPEVQAASAVAQVLELEHTIKRFDHQHISSVADEVVRLTGGLTPLHHPAKVMKYIYELKQNNQFFLLGGAPGNNLSGSFIPSKKYLDPKNLDTCMSLYCAKMNLGGLDVLKAYVSSVFNDDAIDSFLSESSREMELSINSAAGSTAAHKITAWQMSWGFPAFSANSPIHNHPDIMEAFAHLDYTYCDLMSKLPATWLYKRTFYDYMIYSCLPDLRHIIYANTGKVLSGDFTVIELSKVPESGFSFHEFLNARLEKNPILKQKLLRTKQLIYKLYGYKQKKKAAPPFLYKMMRDDNILLSNLIEAVHSYPELRLIFSPDKCIRFVNGIKAGQKQTFSYRYDAELVGSLAAICYSAQCLSRI
jgi:hypothetical protein